jgi:hypothetical protein
VTTTAERVGTDTFPRGREIEDGLAEEIDRLGEEIDASARR